MTVEEAVAERLVEWPAVTSLVSTRIYQLMLPQSATLPAVRVQMIDDPRQYHLRGSDSLSRSRIQVDSYADTGAGSDPYGDVNAVADAIEAALSGQSFSAGAPDVQVSTSFQIGRRALYEPGELRQVRVMQEFYVWSRRLN